MPKDILGQEVSVGDYIAYSAKMRRSAIIKLGQVEKILDDDKVRVKGAEAPWNDSDYMKERGWEPNDSLSTLHYSTRWVRLDPSMVPEQAKLAVSCCPKPKEIIGDYSFWKWTAGGWVRQAFRYQPLDVTPDPL